MANAFFQFKQFTVHHERCAMKVTTDACLFGAWVAQELGKVTDSNIHLLDVGTGTGLLSLMVAQKCNGLIDAVEIETTCAAQAADNITVSPWKERINIVQADVLQWQTATKYDCIFSNPPFYQNSLKSPTAEKNVAHHDEGLRLPDLLNFVGEQLKDEGYFFLLLPATRRVELESLLANKNLYLTKKILVQQTPKHRPFRMMLQGSRQKVSSVLEETVTIKDYKGNYTSAFVSLLKDYYLNL